MDDFNPNTLDELADLFLTGSPTRREPVPPPAKPPLASAEDVAASNPLDGPAPMKLSPKPASARPAPAPPQAPDMKLPPPEEAYDAEFREAFDAARVDEPRLRLQPADDGADADPDADDAEVPEVADAVTAEAVLLGNLPSLAGPWLTQYAQALADQDGAVAVLHVDEDAVDLELVEPAGVRSAERGGSVRVPPRGRGGAPAADTAGLVETLDRLVTAAGRGASPVRTVLVHLPGEGGAAERLHDFEHWTLLSGADDAAVVAGYRLLKRLLEADERAARAKVGLMVVGSDEAAGRHAARRLRSAAAHFLQTPLELIGYQQKMVPARCRTLGRFPADDDTWGRLTRWLAALEPRAHDEPPAVPPRGLPPLDRPVHVQLHDERFDSESDPDATTQAEDDAIEVGFESQPVGDGEVDLLALLDTSRSTGASIPGGIALEARCPSQPDTQLALDAAGRLHLLFRHDSSMGDPPTPREAIVELVAVRDWARQHRQLLQLTERGRRFDPDADPTLHLFTDRAEHAVHLVARLGDLLKLHLLRDVSVGEHHTLFCTPLSA